MEANASTLANKYRMSQAKIKIADKNIPSSTLFGITLALTASVLWGAMGVCVQFVFESTPIQPLELSAIRMFLAGLTLFLVNALFAAKELFKILRSLKDFVGSALSGLILFGGHLTFFYAVYASNAGTGAIFLTLVPLFAGIYLFVRGKQPFTLREFLCCGLAIVGVILIVSKGDLSSFDFNWGAILWGLACAVLSTVYSIQPKPLIEKWGVLPVVTWGMLCAGIFGIAIASPWQSLEAFSTENYLALVFIVLFGTVAAFWLYLLSLKYLSPVMVGLIVCVEPTSAYLFGIAFMGLRLGWLECLGIGLVLANVIILSYRPAPPKRRAPPSKLEELQKS